MSEPTMDLEEFQRLLPFYVNGTLAPQQAAACTAFLERHPEARQQWQFAHTLRERLQDYARQPDPLHGYDALAQRLADARAADARANEQRAADMRATEPRATDMRPADARADQMPAPWWQRAWTSWLSWAGGGGRGASPAMALLLLLVTVQLGVTLAPLVLAPEPAYRGVAAPVRTAHLKLVVKAQTRFDELALLLEANHCHIVWGPSATGELWLALDQPAQGADVRARLAASPLVDDAVLLERSR